MDGIYFPAPLCILGKLCGIKTCDTQNDRRFPVKIIRKIPGFFSGLYTHDLLCSTVKKQPAAAEFLFETIGIDPQQIIKVIPPVKTDKAAVLIQGFLNMIRPDIQSGLPEIFQVIGKNIENRERIILPEKTAAFVCLTVSGRSFGIVISVPGSASVIFLPLPFKFVFSFLPLSVKRLIPQSMFSVTVFFIP